uniref:Uncharacterized protein n=1 Tax=Salix viminalis TaxID=40686 RepID=A0A6N2NBC0_SALVM
MISAGVLLAINEAQQTKISIDQAQQASNLSRHGLAAQNSISKTVADSSSTAASLYCTFKNLLLQLMSDLFLNSVLRRALRFSYKQLLLQQNPNSTRGSFVFLEVLRLIC